MISDKSKYFAVRCWAGCDNIVVSLGCKQTSNSLPSGISGRQEMERDGTSSSEVSGRNLNIRQKIDFGNILQCHLFTVLYPVHSLGGSGMTGGKVTILTNVPHPALRCIFIIHSWPAAAPGRQ